MPATKPQPYISQARFRELPGVESSARVTPTNHRNGATRAAWDRVISRTLKAWLRDPSQLEDEGIDAPSGTVVRLSLDLAESCREKGQPAPDSIVPDPSGGIVFERREGDVSEVFHVWDDGTVEYMQFEGARLVERCPNW